MKQRREGRREGGAEVQQHPLLPAPQRCWDGATPADENNVMFLVVAPPEELQKQLVEQVELRKKLEREFQHLKGKASIYAVERLCGTKEKVSTHNFLQ